jgi:4-amino-4-deoxychorismate lyase
MFRLIETIRLEDGIPQNIEFHNIRMMRSLRILYSLTKEIQIEKFLVIPDYARTGIFKCRLEYDTEIRLTEFIKYTIKPVRSLKLAEADEIIYDHKYTDRRSIEKLVAGKGHCDDILIIKKGRVTDSSYANVIFKDSSGIWVTPGTYLLPGTRRANLLGTGTITEKEIRVEQIKDYSEVKLINAMMGINDTEGIPVSNIFR